MTNLRLGMAAGAAAAIAWAATALGQAAMQQPQQAAPGQRTQQEKKISDDLRDALQKLHADNQSEVQLAKEAEQRAQSSQVKEFAHRMIDQHQQSDQKLQQVAQQLAIPLQGDKYNDALKDSQGTIKDLAQKQGADFDRAFMDHMAKANRSHVNDMHDAAMKAAEEHQPQLAEMFGQTEATLHAHYAMAKQIDDQLREQARAEQQRRAAERQGRTPGLPPGRAPVGPPPR